jgi:type I restriction enzyme S subunit
MYLTSKNIRFGYMDLSNISYISEEEHKEIYTKCPVKRGDILLTKDGANAGNCAINKLTEEFSLLSSVAVLRGKPEIICQEYLFQVIYSEEFQKRINESISGQAITRITLKKIENYSILFPSLPEQQKIAACLSSLDDLIAAQSAKVEELKQHKRGLMQGLFPSPEEEG